MGQIHLTWLTSPRKLLLSVEQAQILFITRGLRTADTRRTASRVFYTLPAPGIENAPAAKKQTNKKKVYRLFMQPLCNAKISTFLPLQLSVVFLLSLHINLYPSFLSVSV